MLMGQGELRLKFWSPQNISGAWQQNNIGAPCLKGDANTPINVSSNQFGILGLLKTQITFDKLYGAICFIQ